MISLKISNNDGPQLYENSEEKSLQSISRTM